MLPQVQEPTDLDPDRLHVAVIQLGGQFECAMTRGWLQALAARAAVEVVTRHEHREILDVGDDPSGCHGLRRSPLDLLRIANTLKNLRLDHAIRLDDTFAGRLLGAVCKAEKRAISERESLRPAAIDAALASIFQPLGVPAPERAGPLTLDRETTRRARERLEEFGLRGDQPVVMYAPAAATDPASFAGVSSVSAAGPPVVLMPPGAGLDLLARLAGRAYLVQASDLALRAALIGCARVLVSNHPPSIELAALMQTKLSETGGVSGTAIE